MSKLVGAAIFGQSGGPTSVINSSAAGIISEAFKHDEITAVYGAANGIHGLLNEVIYDMSKEDPNELELLKTTPSSSFGSCRYKLKDYKVDDTDYKALLEIFRKYNIRYFFYNGGNDSMDTCNKVSKYLKSVGYECRVVGIPKTIDNDLNGTDHCPGYGSAAKYIATSIMEVYQDSRVYENPMITVFEIMGRNAGWLTAASALAAHMGSGPDLIYLPETSFDLDKFYDDVMKKFNETHKVLIAVSEGIRDKNGKYITEYSSELCKDKDAFGHSQLGGLAATLAAILKSKTKAKVRGIEFSLLQRCASHIASQTDINEAFIAGQTAVRAAVEDGITDKMVAMERNPGSEYKCNFRLVDLTLAANAEKKVPREWINEEGNFINKEFIDYALPLIQGEPELKFENGLPRYARLKKIQVNK